MQAKDAKALLGSAPRWRGDCPDCGGSNSLSVSSETGTIKWFCFKASCKSRGMETTNRSMEDIVNGLLQQYNRYDTIDNSFVVPSYLTSIYSNDAAVRYFTRQHALEHYQDGYIKLRYDPKQDRAVFLIERDKEIVDGAGRALHNRDYKWFRYGHSGRSFLLNRTGGRSTLVITEDIPSACVVGYNFHSLALLGTELSDVDILDCIGYNKVIVALDPDAYSKGIKMAARLSAYVDAKAILIPNDLKYFKPNEVKDMINGVLHRG